MSCCHYVCTSGRKGPAVQTMILSRFLHFVLRTHSKSRLAATELIASVVMMHINSYKSHVLELMLCMHYITLLYITLYYTTLNINYFTYISSNIANKTFQMKFAHLNALYNYILIHHHYLKELSPLS